MEQNSTTIKTIDKLIYFFFVVFLLSLTNSIFANQAGYYFAFILILLRYFLTKENQFQKTGIEIAFAWYIAAEIISAIFSGEHGAAFHNVFKRALLIPLVYTTFTASVNLDRAKKYFKIYIGASLVTVLIYLFYAYKFYIYNLYSIDDSGPSLFQYPITAAEILSFTVVYLFAFSINEKTNWKNKIMLFAAFAISMLALVATYKRTGWIGAAFGILIILVIKKQWKVPLPLIFAGVVLLITQTNISEVSVFGYDNLKLTKEFNFKTTGKASSILPGNGGFYLCDYDNGLVEYKDNVAINITQLPSPVIQLDKWNEDYFVSRLVDTRFIVLKRNEHGLIPVDTLLTPGFTYDFTIENNMLYILDKDSGLTVFENPENIDKHNFYRQLADYYYLYADSTRLIALSPPRKISVFSLKNGLLEDKLFDYTNSSNIDFIFYNNGKLFVSDSKGLSLFSVSESGLTLTDSNAVMRKLYRWTAAEKKLFACDLNGNVYELKYPVENRIEILSQKNIGFSPESMSYLNGRLYFTNIKRSRSLSIFDPYLPSNAVRFSLWSAGWKMFLDHPLFGVGDIDLQKLYKQYKNPYDKEIQGHMHNNFMHILVTLGLFGFIGFCYLIFKIILLDWKIYKDTVGASFISSYSLGTIAAFCAFLASGMTELNFGDHEIITLVWFTLGMNVVLYYFYKKNNNTEFAGND